MSLSPLHSSESEPFVPFVPPAGDTERVRTAALEEMQQIDAVLEILDDMSGEVADALRREATAVRDAIKQAGPGQLHAGSGLIKRLNDCLQAIHAAQGGASAMVDRKHAQEKAIIEDVAVARREANNHVETAIGQMRARAEENARAEAAAATERLIAAQREQARAEEEAALRRSGLGAVVAAVVPRPVREAVGRAAHATDRAVRNASYGAAQRVGILDEQGAETARTLDTMRQTGTAAEREYANREWLDATGRRLLGQTFVGEEIRKALPALRDAGFRGTLAERWNGYGEDDVIRALENNGAFVGRFDPLGGHAANAQWSANNIRRIDLNGDGQLDEREIASALRDGPGTVRRANQNRALRTEASQSLREAATQGLALQGDGALGQRDGRVDIDEVMETLRRRGVTRIDQIDTAAELAQALGGTTPAPARSATSGPAFRNEVAQSVRDAAAQGLALRGDANGDGRVTTDEAVAALRARGVTRIDQIDTAAELQAALARPVRPQQRGN